MAVPSTPTTQTKKVRLIKNGLEVPFSVKVEIGGESYAISGVRRIHNNREWDAFIGSPEYLDLVSKKASRQMSDAVFYAGTATRLGPLKSWDVVTENDAGADFPVPVTAENILALPDEARLELYRELAKPYADELAKKPVSSSS